MSVISIVPNSLNDVLINSATSSMSVPLLRLPHPRTGLPSLFLSQKNEQSEDVLFEVQAISPHSKRSWFLGGNTVIADGKLLLMSPIDPLFLLIPILSVTVPSDDKPPNFRPFDDIMEEMTSKMCQEQPSFTSSDISQFSNLACVRKAMSRICEEKRITDDITVYRFSRLRLLNALSSKVNHLSQSSAIAASPFFQRQLSKDQLLDEGKEELRRVGRIRLACELVGQYVPSDIIKDLLASYDFSALDAHINALTDQTNLLMTKKESSSSKDAGSANDKKRKAASQASKGVTKLMKANTTGMSKISSFFKKTDK